VRQIKKIAPLPLKIAPVTQYRDSDMAPRAGILRLSSIFLVAIRVSLSRTTVEGLKFVDLNAIHAQARELNLAILEGD
jgi:hypothetical protein